MVVSGQVGAVSPDSVLFDFDEFLKMSPTNSLIGIENAIYNRRWDIIYSCKTKSQLLLIDSQKIRKYFGNYFEKILEKKHKIVNDIELLKGTSLGFLTGLTGLLDEKFLDFKKTIYEEGSTDNNFYIVLRGRVMIFKNLQNKNEEKQKVKKIFF